MFSASSLGFPGLQCNVFDNVVRLPLPIYINLETLHSQKKHEQVGIRALGFRSLGLGRANL